MRRSPPLLPEAVEEGEVAAAVGSAEVIRRMQEDSLLGSQRVRIQAQVMDRHKGHNERSRG